MKQTSFSVFVAGGSVTVTLVLVAMTENVNGQVVLGAAASTSILAANAARKGGSIYNGTGASIFLRFAAAAAAATNYELPSNSVYSLNPTAGANVYQGEIRAFSTPGGTITVLEFI